MTEANEASPEWVSALKGALRTLPKDYAQCYEEITRMRHIFQAQIAEALQATLNSHIARAPQDTFAEKQQIAKSVNRDLRLLNLCVCCPGTGKPAILVADFRDDEAHNSRFRFQIIEPSKRQLRKHATAKLPALRLREALPRVEGAADRTPGRGDGGDSLTGQ